MEKSGRDEDTQTNFGMISYDLDQEDLMVTANSTGAQFYSNMVNQP